MKSIEIKTPFSNINFEKWKKELNMKVMQKIQGEFGLCLSYGRINAWDWHDNLKVETFDQIEILPQVKIPMKKS